MALGEIVARMKKGLAGDEERGDEKNGRKKRAAPAKTSRKAPATASAGDNAASVTLTKPSQAKASPLNPEQEKAVRQMLAFVKSRDAFFLLKGYAGTGKTFAIQEFVKRAQQRSSRYGPLTVALCAPTNKAVRVIRDMAITAGLEDVNFATLHQLLGLVLEEGESEKPKLRRAPNTRPSLNENDIVILDEGSMVSQELWDMIIREAAYGGTKIIVMGDDAQLPPVGERDSPCFREIAPVAALTTIMRQEDARELGEAIDAVRQRVFDPKAPLPQRSAASLDRKCGYFFLTRQQWREEMCAAFASAAFQEDPDFVRVIAWRNSVVNSLNEIIRDILFPGATAAFMPGERLIVRDAVLKEVVTRTNNRESVAREIVLPTSSEVTVVKVKAYFDGEFNVFDLTVRSDDGVINDLTAIPPAYDHPDQVAYSAKLRGYAEAAKDIQSSGAGDLWFQYWRLKNKYARVGYAYAMTAHKAQGSTFDNVFIAQPDILSNRNAEEAAKCLYVAYSRARRRVYVHP